MRGLIITLILFSLLVCLILFNIVFVNKLIDNMNIKANSLTQNPSEVNNIIINELKSYWEKERAWISLSVSYEDIEELTDIIDSLQVANFTNNINQFKINLELLKNAIEEIGRLEKFSIQNIL